MKTLTLSDVHLACLQRSLRARRAILQGEIDHFHSKLTVHGDGVTVQALGMLSTEMSLLEDVIAEVWVAIGGGPQS